MHKHSRRYFIALQCFNTDCLHLFILNLMHFWIILFTNKYKTSQLIHKLLYYHAFTITIYNSLKVLCISESKSVYIAFKLKNLKAKCTPKLW